VVIPDLAEVKGFANHLHATGKHWNGEMFGWPAEYTPERRKKPLGSKMRFTPADFWIGESGVWFYSLMWERGKDKEPVEFLDDRGIVKQGWRGRPTRHAADALPRPKKPGALARG
jgi:hypothetical protein